MVSYDAVVNIFNPYKEVLIGTFILIIIVHDEVAASFATEFTRKCK
jgi:hypothetical protein